MWNLSMRDPLPKGMGQKFLGYHSYNSAQSSHSAGAPGKTNGQQNAGRKKSDYCWNFNKGVPCKFGSRCKFIERCKYCDSPAHGVNNCPKLQKKSEGKPVQESRDSS